MHDARRAWPVLAAAPIVLAFIVAVGAGPRLPATAASAEPAPAPCVGLEPDGCAGAWIAAAQGTAEEQLAAKYAPIVYLREQDSQCGREAYRPSPVEVVLGNPRVRLVSSTPEGKVTQERPSAADLYRLRGDMTAYLDLPGRPGNAGCTYVRDFRELGAETPAVTYAHIQREKGYVALQYWFYYYFNDWNNQHESDWEMIQLLFDADSATEALGQEPLRVSYAQHSGGETAGWNDKKLRKEGDHPVVYASAGSHASYFQPHVYLGLGERGSGLGCDDAAARARPVQLEARLVPATVAGADDPFAWTAFPGRWGEHQPGQNNGPLGPNNTKRWTQPVTHFDEDIRDVSATVPGGSTLGPNAVDLLCKALGLSGKLLGRYYESPLTVALTTGAVVLVAGGFVVGSVRADLFTSLAGRSRSPGATRSGRSSGSAVSLYLRYPGVFLATGVVFIPIGIASALLNKQLELDIDDLALSLSLLGGLPLFAAFVFVNSAVAATLREIEAGRRPRFLDGYRIIWMHIRPLLWARVKALGIVSLLALSVAGLPFALQQLVRWLFVEQAIILGGADSRTALAVSARAVRGRWWRTVALVVVLAIVGGLLGPVLAIAVLLLLRPPAEVANLISSAVYALVLPLVFIAVTQFYRALTADG